MEQEPRLYCPFINTTESTRDYTNQSKRRAEQVAAEGRRRRAAALAMRGEGATDVEIARRFGWMVKSVKVILAQAERDRHADVIS